MRESARKEIQQGLRKAAWAYAVIAVLVFVAMLVLVCGVVLAAPCPPWTADCTLASHPAALVLDSGKLLIEVCYTDIPADSCTRIKCASQGDCSPVHPTLRQWCQELAGVQKPLGGESLPMPLFSPGEVCATILSGATAEARVSGNPAGSK